MASNSQLCLFDKEFSINFNGNTILAGQIWSSSGTNSSEIFCVEIIDNIDEPGSRYSATTQYSDCYECVTENNGLYLFTICGSIAGGEIAIPVSELGEDFFLSGLTTLTSGSFYLEYENDGNISNGCVTFNTLLVLTPEGYAEVEKNMEYQL